MPNLLASVTSLWIKRYAGSRQSATREYAGSSSGPMREPVFNETLQLGIVVRDLEATIRSYVDDYGIGPWEVHEFNAGNAEDFREYGQAVERSWRLAVATVRRSGS
jgi:hypothetical protein